MRESKRRAYNNGYHHQQAVANRKVILMVLQEVKDGERFTKRGLEIATFGKLSGGAINATMRYFAQKGLVEVKGKTWVKLPTANTVKPETLDGTDAVLAWNALKGHGVEA